MGGELFLKVQLKGRLVADRKYAGKDIHVGFFDGDAAFVYPHDAFLAFAFALERGCLSDVTVSWGKRGTYNWPSVPRWAHAFLAPFRI